MPQRPVCRTTLWLVPPSLDEWVPADHPVRFIADVLDDFDTAAWTRLGIRPEPAERGAPRYDPAMLLAVWVYGCSVGIRSCRGLEAACRDQIPFRWLTGNQLPDHNTLFRFLKRYPAAMTALYAETVRIAVRAGLVDWALQAVDGTKVGASAARERTVTADDLDRLEAVLDARIAAILAETTDRQVRDEPEPPTLPPSLQDAQVRKTRIAEVRQQLAKSDRAMRNLTDADAYPMTTRQGTVPAYNAQVVVSAIPAGDGAAGGRLVVGAQVTTEVNDRRLLPAMVEAAAACTGQVAAITVADAGYHSAAVIAACAAAGQVVVVPEQGRSRPVLPDQFRPTDFTYDAASDSYMCPAGQRLLFRDHQTKAGWRVRRYRAPAPTCRACALRDRCTTAHRHGRALSVPVGADALPAHRAWMATAPAQAASRQRKAIVEPVFGILKERFGARRFHRRGLAAVQTEWAMLCAAFNLRTLGRWRHLVAASAGSPVPI